MLSTLTSRLIQLPLILAVIFITTFTLVWLIPGNPLERPDARRPPAEIEQAMLRQYNLHNPLAFATSYLENIFLHGDFGPSLQYRGQRVSDIIARALPISAMLGLAAIVIAIVIGTAAGVMGAIRPGSTIDLASLAVAVVGISLPGFVTGSILLVVFAGLLHWLPISGWGSPQHIVLPAVTLGIAPAAYIARLLRLELADIMKSDFIRTARAKGLSQKQAIFKHAVKLAMLPVVSFLGPAAAAAMTGSFVVEKVFNIPGLGEYFVNAVLNKDQFLILAVVLTYAAILVLFNLIVDLAYAFIDPRISLK